MAKIGHKGGDNMKKIMVLFAALMLMATAMVSAVTFDDDFNSTPFPAWSQDGSLANFTWDGVSSVSGVGRNYQNISGFDVTKDYTVDIDASFPVTGKTFTLAMGGKTNGLANYAFWINFLPTSITIKCIGGNICKLNNDAVTTQTFAVGPGLGNSHLTLDYHAGTLTYLVNSVALASTTVNFHNTTSNTFELYMSTTNVSVDRIRLNQCAPDWSCSGYGACVDGLQLCNAVTDGNTCGSTYTGDYSEFTPQECECIPDWNPSSWSSCILVESNYMQSRSFTDNNDCGQTHADETRNCGKSNNHYGATTDFAQVADPTNISNAVYETAYGKIAWQNPISIVNVDLDNAIIIRSDLLFVNTSLVTPSMDSIADVAFQMDRTYDWCTKGFQVYYSENAYSDIKKLAEAYSDGKATKLADKARIGLDCYNDSICKAVTCTQSKVGFQAQHFSGFGLFTDRSGVISGSRGGEVMYCDSSNNCYASPEAAAQAKTAFAAVPAGSTSNPFKAIFDWIASLFGTQSGGGFP
jgi:hypothetical protein